MNIPNKLISITKNFFCRLFKREKKALAPTIMVSVPEILLSGAKPKDVWENSVKEKATRALVDELYQSSMEALEREYNKQIENISKGSQEPKKEDKPKE